MQTLKERVHWLRDASKLSQRGFAKRAGIASRLISFIEAGGRENPELKTLQRIADATGSTVGWLANGEGEPPTVEEVLATIGEVTDDETDEHAEPAA